MGVKQKGFTNTTVQELKKEIRELTMSINMRLSEYYEGDTRDKLLDKEIEYLKEVTNTSKKSTFIALNFTGKRKSQLYAQLQELKYMADWDISTPQGVRERSEKELASYRKFKKNQHSNLRFEQWRRMANIFGSATDMLKDFGGSSDLVTTIHESVRKGDSSKKVLDAMAEVIKENKDEGKSSVDYIDDLRKKLGLMK